jgi:tetratricopeptide (TPR) repeat protein
VVDGVDRLLVDLRADGRVQVSSWAAGEWHPRPAGEPAELTWPLGDDDLADLRWYLEQYLRLPTAVYGERGSRVAGLLPRWGERIFTAVFGAGPAHDAYVAARSRGGPLEISLLSQSAEQLGRPWELMTAPGRPVPVALDGVAVTRGLHHEGMKQGFETVPGSRLRVLMVISRPAGTADIGYQMIARPLLPLLEAVRGAVELVVLRPPTLERLREVLGEARRAGEPFQVVHFDGHGVFGPAPAGGGGGWGTVMYHGPGPRGMLAFERPGGGPDLVSADKVAQVLAEARVPVVVLNACQSGQLGGQVEAAVATRLLQEGCAGVVAMAYSVYAVAAAEFMTAFYERLLAGDRLADAVTAGRARLALHDGRPSLKGTLPLADWMVPVLYTRGEVSFPGLRTGRSGPESLDEAFERIRAGGGETPSADDDLAPVGEFVGRDALLYTLDVAARLQRVVVLHGPGGTGKTELAKAFGRWWRDTGGVDEPEWVIWHSFEPGVASFGLDGVVNAIGLRLYGTRFAMLDSAKRQAAVEDALMNRRLLLLWDNFESVHTMPDPTQATPPLPEPERERLRAFVSRIAGRGKSAVVITSRTPESWLGPDVRRIEVDGLTTEEAIDYADELLAPYPGARGRRESRAFGDLMRWLDGHPLSMRLVLPHLETTDAERLLAGLQGMEHVPWDAGGGRNTSLSASIAYSFDHLAAEDQRALTVLSLFHGVADADVLGNFSARPDVPECFRGHTETHWAELLGRAAAVGLLTDIGLGMFRIHPALPRCLAARWRATDEDSYDEQRGAARRALVEAHAAFGRWLRIQIDGDARIAFVLIAQQQQMLTSMLGHALRCGLWGPAQDILQPLDDYWDLRGLFDEARAWSDRVRLAVEETDGTPPSMSTAQGELWAFAVGAQANRELEAGWLDSAEDAYRSILHALEEQPEGADRFLAVSYHQLGRVAQERGGLEEAERWFRRSLVIKEKLGDRPGMAFSFHQLGVVAELRGGLEEAEGWFRRSLAIMEELGDRPRMAISFHQLGMVAEERGALEEAEGWYRRSLAINEELGNRSGMAKSFHQIGIVAQLRGGLEEAEEWFRRSLVIEEELGNRPGMATSFHQLGMVAEERGALEEAEGWYRRSLVIEEGLGNRSGMARSFHQIGIVAQLRGGLEEAEGWFRRSLAIDEELGRRTGIAVSYGALGLLAEERGHVGEAMEWMVRCATLFEQFPHRDTGPGPRHLRRLTGRAGIAALEETWHTVTGNPLPPAVRQYVLEPSGSEG